MPKIVDHDERREEILQAAMRVICTVGLDGTTMRAIAREAGYSNGGLSHYFADKDDILRSVLVMTHRRSVERRAQALAGKSALDRLWALLLDNLPLDEERSVETLMEMTFWPRAVSSPELRDFQHEAAHALLADLRRLIVDQERLMLAQLEAFGFAVAKLNP
jgi:AcrR family transcriptional regulator